MLRKVLRITLYVLTCTTSQRHYILSTAVYLFNGTLSFQRHYQEHGVIDFEFGSNGPCRIDVWLPAVSDDGLSGRIESQDRITVTT